MSDSAPTPDETPADPSARPRVGGFTLDLSGSNVGNRPRKKKGAPAVVTKTINLSTRPAPKPEVEAPKAEAPKPLPPRPAPPSQAPRNERHGNERHGGGQHGGGQHGGKPPRDGKKQEPRREGGHSLADLLDPETLARLRGEG